MMMANTSIARVVGGLDAFAAVTGKVISWLTLVMMALTCIVVVLRYGFDLGSIALQEAVTYLHATVFLLGAAYTFADDEHVRVDIFYRTFNPRQKAWVNAVGGILFLMPLSVFLLAISWGFAMDSWAISESSGDAGGIAAVFILKSLMPLAALTLGLQGLADTLRSALVLVQLPRDEEKTA